MPEKYELIFYDLDYEEITTKFVNEFNLEKTIEYMKRLDASYVVVKKLRKTIYITLCEISFP